MHTANRLRRYALILLAYDFSIRYIDGGNFAYADFVSRLIDSHGKPGLEDVVNAAIREDTSGGELENEWASDIVAVEAIKSLPVSLMELKQATDECNHLQKVISFTKSRWPQKKNQVKDAEVKEYFSVRSELQVIGDCLYYGNRPVIPIRLRSKSCMRDSFCSFSQNSDKQTGVPVESF